ncbi:hypothetical protein GCM10023176_08010 [Micromonospora coerulea]|uniref:Uncharacterized protein n=1 Tax=Micromonospora coerulea TaxID=47856 RepID=A0ABP8S969_9ACTN
MQLRAVRCRSVRLRAVQCTLLLPTCSPIKGSRGCCGQAETDRPWMTGIGVTAANKILDDLAKHLSA